MNRYIKLNQVRQMTALSKSTIYRLIGEGSFPKQINLSARSVAWRTSDIEQWCEEKERMSCA